MSEALAILLTLIAYKITLVAIGLWAARRTRDGDDFFLGGRKLGGAVAAISASASSSSAWTLLGVSGAAYLWGVSALWLFPATLGGFLLNWLWVGPRLMRLSRETGALTLTEVVAGADRATVVLASGVVLVSFMFYIAAQFQAAGDAFAASFDLSADIAILIGGVIILIYTLLGGFWAVSLTDTLQGLLMALTAVVLPVAALVAVGGVQALSAALAASGTPQLGTWHGTHAGIAAIGFVLGTLGIGLGYPGQPHVVNRFMALRDRRALRRGRVIAICWALLVYAGMLLLGLCGRVLLGDIASGEQVFFELAGNLFPPVLAGIMTAAVLSAIMSTADSQLLVASSTVAHDLRRSANRGGVALPRVVVLVLSMLAMALAIGAPEAIFTRVLFAWHAVGAAFGPILIAELIRRPPRPGARRAAMAAGFVLTVVAYWLPDTPGDWIERLVPLAVASAIVALGSRRRTVDAGAELEDGRL